jgi:hypothetical protein
LTSYVERHSDGSLSAILLTGLSVPWFMTKPSRREKDLRASKMASGPTCMPLNHDSYRKLIL